MSYVARCIPSEVKSEVSMSIETFRERMQWLIHIICAVSCFKLQEARETYEAMNVLLREKFEMCFDSLRQSAGASLYIAIERALTREEAEVALFEELRGGSRGVLKGEQSRERMGLSRAPKRSEACGGLSSFRKIAICSCEHA